jgi:DNA-binding SARP family transcriptional activator/O-methyltransferase involved in polyketide biosynthesis
MRIRALGSVEVRNGAEPIVIRQRKLRQMICVLAVADRVVTSEELQTLLWEGTGTKDSLSALTTTINRCRHVLSADRLVREPGGYRLALDGADDYLDVRHFHALVDEARQIRGSQPQRACDLYEAAVGLWVDRPLADLPDTPAAAMRAQRLVIKRRDAIEALAELRVVLDRHEDLIRELPAYLEEDPVNERLWVALLLGLYRGGRRAEALRVSDEARDMIFTETGAEPGVALAGLRTRIEQNDPALTWKPAVATQESRAVAAGIDPNVVSPARIYDWLLGGTNNFEIDRLAGEKLVAQIPDVREVARRNRAFLRWTVEMLTRKGIRQFLDIGTGLPTQGSVHEVAREVGSSVRVVYVDYDPMVLAHGQALIDDSQNTAYVLGDVLKPSDIFNDTQTRRLIDPAEPLAVLMLAVLHFYRADDIHLALEKYRSLMASGSALAISHVTRDGSGPKIIQAMQETAANSTVSLYMRSKPEIEALFTGFELIAPLNDPAAFGTTTQLSPCKLAALGGIGIKP